MTEQDDDERVERRDRIERGLAAAGGALLGTALGDPVGLAAGAGVAPLLEVFIHKVWDELSRDSRHRATEVLVTAFHATNYTPDQFQHQLDSSDRLRLLTATAMTAGANTAWEDKVRTLGRSLASGLLADDDAAIDTEQLVLAAIADIEGPQLCLLDLLVRFEPGNTVGGPVLVPVRNTVRRTWDDWHIRQARPRLGPAVTGLLGTLQRHGLVIQDANVAKVLEMLSKEVSSEFSRLQQHSNGGAPRFNNGTKPLSRIASRQLTPEPSWSPTSLGDIVHQRFMDAGAHVPDDWATDPDAT